MLSFKQYLQEAVQVKLIPGKGNVMTRVRPSTPAAPAAPAKPASRPLTPPLTPTQRNERLMGKLSALRQKPSEELRRLDARNKLLTTASTIFGKVENDPETGAAVYRPGLIGNLKNAYERGKEMRGIDVKKTTMPIAGKLTHGLLSRIEGMNIATEPPRPRPSKPPEPFLSTLRGLQSSIKSGLRNFFEPDLIQTIRKTRAGESLNRREYDQLNRTSPADVAGTVVTLSLCKNMDYKDDY